jgi:hypothetical protein
VSLVAPGEQLCSRDSFYLSADGGASWRPLPHHSIVPAGVSDGWCDRHATAHHLFLVYSFSPASSAPQISLLERSDDDGATWARADAGVSGLGENALYSVPQIGPGETLALTVVHVSATPRPNSSPATELWTSPDAARTWTRAPLMPEHTGTF